MGYHLYRSQKFFVIIIVVLVCVIIRDTVVTLWNTSADRFCVNFDLEPTEVDKRSSSLNLSYCEAIKTQISKENTPDTCKPREFIAKLNEVLSAKTRHVPLRLLRSCRYVFYNRVPKCGSRSLYDTFLTLGEKRGFTVRKKAMGLGRDPTSRMHKINPYIEKLEQMEGCHIIAKHLYFINLPRKSKKPIIMINVLRDPLDQLLSVYSWKRFGDATSEYRGRRFSNSTLGLDDCISTSNASDSCFYWHMLSFPFLCQYTEGCWTRQEPSINQLQHAKWHIDNSFLLVGIMEDMKSFLEVLEVALPQFFSGAVQLYETKKDHLLAKYKSTRKETISARTEEILRYRLRYHYDLYYYAKRRFDQIYETLIRQKCQ